MEKITEPKLIEAWKKTSVDLMQEAKTNYRQMQRGWWFFAKSIYDIKKSKAYEASGYENFKQYCEKEYPGVAYTTMFKYASIVKDWQKTIDLKLSKNPNFSLPAYETCYSVSALSSDKVPEEEINKLKRQVIEARIPFAEVRKRIKALKPEVKDESASAVIGIQDVNELVHMVDVFLDTLRGFDKASLTSKELKRFTASLEEMVNECEKVIY